MITTRVVLSFLVLAIGLGASALIWRRLAPAVRTKGPGLIFIGAVGGAVVGAKLGFLFAEGWHYRHDWLALASGRTILGALLGGYAGVELTKKALGESRATGDAFAVVVPVALCSGRIGCLIRGCCPGVVCDPAWYSIVDAQGVHRWPSQVIELLFNLAFVVLIAMTWRVGALKDNRFHVYLIAYGLFRFIHESARADARWWEHTPVGPIGGYHVLALGLISLGAWRFMQRRSENAE